MDDDFLHLTHFINDPSSHTSCTMESVAWKLISFLQDENPHKLDRNSLIFKCKCLLRLFSTVSAIIPRCAHMYVHCNFFPSLKQETSVERFFNQCRLFYFLWKQNRLLCLFTFTSTWSLRISHFLSNIYRRNRSHLSYREKGNQWRLDKAYYWILHINALKIPLEERSQRQP